MRILVLSDCHGVVTRAEKVLLAHPDIKIVFYLGDGADAFYELNTAFSEKEFNIVAGNCDYNSVFSNSGQAKIEGVNIFYTHGHKYGVKYGTETLYKMAKDMSASLVLYGHTHVAKEEYRDGIYLVNPGALYHARDCAEGYAIIDVTPKGIVTVFRKI